MFLEMIVFAKEPVMLNSVLFVVLLGQCSGSSCAMPQGGYGFAQFAAPQFNYAPVAPPAAPTLWRAVDSEGSAFTHTDPAYLQSWIAGRNASLAKPAAVEPPKAPPPTLCPCADGRCPCLAKAAKAASTVIPPSLPDVVALGPPPPEPR
jgi:hypothetical protein